MAAREVLKMGNPNLRQVAAPVVDFSSRELEDLVADLWDTMATEGGVGIAAPQIGVSLRVVVFGMEVHPRGLDVPPVPRTVLINPIITPLDDETELGWEGCLSVPGMRGMVRRHLHIRYSGFTESGHSFEHEVEGYHARVVQHECDHLDGVLYPQRMDDLTLFGYEDEIAASLALEEPEQA